MFTIELLQAINNWQANGKGDEKKKLCQDIILNSTHLPDKFKTLTHDCYRKLNLGGYNILDIGRNLYLEENYSSWTFNKKVAQSFDKGVPEPGQIGYIFKITPKNSYKVIVNLDALYNDKKFIEAHEKYKNQILNYNAGIGKYNGSQCEIILNVSSLEISQIWAYGGFSSDIKKLYNQYLERGNPIYNIKQFELKLKEINREAGKNWITSDNRPEAIKKIIEHNMQIPKLVNSRIKSVLPDVSKAHLEG